MRKPHVAEEDKLSRQIIGAAIEVHRHLGPGLLESAYEHCLAREFELRNIPYERQRELPVEYKGIQISCGYRLDFRFSDELCGEWGQALE